jgi:hypothetical protein
MMKKNRPLKQLGDEGLVCKNLSCAAKHRHNLKRFGKVRQFIGRSRVQIKQGYSYNAWRKYNENIQRMRTHSNPN